VRPLTSIRFAAVVTLGLSTLAACVPTRDLAPDQIEKLGKLKEVMDVQATVADPEFKKIGRTAFSDADWAAFADTGNRIQVTSHKIHEFSKGPEFDQLADRLHASAEALSAAAVAKDAAAAPAALADMKATCKTCHSKFK
jgi:cytochrome c556